MRAVVCRRYGPPEVLQLVDMPKPAPKRGEVLVRVHATTVTAGDYRIRGASFGSPVFWLPARLMIGVRGPRACVLGLSFAGVVDEIGAGVTAFKLGDRVFGSTGMRMGAYAEYACVDAAKTITTIPDNTSFDDAAAMVFGGLTAWHFLKEKVSIKSGQRVLINGASGSVGSAAVQIAAHSGATVTGVCSGANADMVCTIGAHDVIDYTKEDVLSHGTTYDIVLDTVGNLPARRTKQLLNEHGTFIEIVESLPHILQEISTSIAGKKKVVGGIAAEKPEYLAALRELLATQVISPVIDRTYPLSEIVEAHRYAEKGHKKGNVVITVAD